MPALYRRLLLIVAKSLVTTIIFFIGAEIALRTAYAVRNTMVRLVPLPYALGDEYGPLPPWLDRLEILVPDEALIWRGVPNARRTYLDIFTPVRSEGDRLALLRRFLPTIPREFRANPTWHVELSSQGFRTSEYALQKPAGTLRVACIGDSWTFGMNVDQERTYPGRLLVRLRAASGAANVEVLNFGLLGYSSFQGLQLLRSHVRALAPDVLVIGFGMNDSEIAGYRDKDMTGGGSPRLAARVVETAAQLESYKLLNYLALLVRFHQKPVEKYIRSEAAEKSGSIDYNTLEPWTRVSLPDYEQNIRAMIMLQSERGGRAILLDNELWDESPYRPLLRRISRETHVPLVDSLQIVADRKQAIEHSLETRLGLARDAGEPADHRPSAGAAGSVGVVFRVFQASVPVPRALSITGTDPGLGNLIPNAIQMRDDGQGGDERAGDGVWSYEAWLPRGSRVFYVYTNSGARGIWEGLDVPSIRQVRIPMTSGSDRIYLPIETFGQLYMQADNWHTNAEGYDLIAAAVEQAIELTR